MTTVIDNSPIVTSDFFTLRPEYDKEYLEKLSWRIDGGSCIDFDKYIHHVMFSFIGYLKSGVRCGIIYICHYGDVWVLDAYRDDECGMPRRELALISYESGRAMVDWFFSLGIADTLYTYHLTKNTRATLMCEKLGFNATEMIKVDQGTFVKMEMTR